MLKSLRYLTFITCIILVGCADRTSITFHVAQGLELSGKAGVEEYPDRTVYRYELERPVVVQTPGRALILEFPAGFKQSGLKVTMGQSTLLERTLDGGFAAGFDGVNSSDTVSFSIPLDPGTRFDGFELLSSAGERKSPNQLPLFAGLGNAVAGVTFAPAPSLDTRIRVSARSGNPSAALIFDISRLTVASDGIVKVSLEYAYTPDPNDPAKVSLIAGRGGNSTVFDVRLRKGGATLYLYEGMCGFVPGSVEILVEGNGFSLTSLSVSKVSRDIDERYQPLTIDMGGVIGYSSGQWRTEDFELFLWNLYPKMLIVDTISYAVQSDFFKRLAFFVEKADSAGELLTDEALEGKHGWNAHDYKAEDLARFFNTAAEEAFPLGEKERLLEEILEKNGVIRKAQGRWLPGEGGLIALSQESPPHLRDLFMAHEGYHGIFFSDIRYRNLSFSIWNDLSALEQRFWREFLLLREYNAQDEYLVVNEFQAYLMQVPLEKLDAYYWKYTVPGLARAVPRAASLVAELKALYPDTFHRSAETLETFLLETAGIGAADLFCLQVRK